MNAWARRGAWAALCADPLAPLPALRLQKSRERNLSLPIAYYFGSPVAFNQRIARFDGLHHPPVVVTHANRCRNAVRSLVECRLDIVVRRFVIAHCERCGGGWIAI